ncbi:MAG TPA: helix-turn-helix domain-containing protein [Rubrivivax sp.]|nr:helix-turn-helix domain-containing protein [Rubrivivax sp.]
MDDSSTMQDAPSPLADRIAARVRELRQQRGLSLDELAASSGVSRSMISLIERGESSPTAVVLEKLSVGLGVSLATLFDAPPPLPEALSRRADQPLWRDPASGYLRRNVSPAGVASPIQVVEVHFPPGARVAYQTGARRPRRWQQVWVLDGCIELTLGEQVHRLQSGDCLAMRLDRPIGYHNPGARTARYAVVLCSEAGPGR